MKLKKDVSQPMVLVKNMHPWYIYRINDKKLCKRFRYEVICIPNKFNDALLYDIKAIEELLIYRECICKFKGDKLFLVFHTIEEGENFIKALDK